MAGCSSAFGASRGIGIDACEAPQPKDVSVTSPALIIHTRVFSTASTTASDEVRTPSPRASETDDIAEVSSHVLLLGDPRWTLPIRNTFVNFQVVSSHALLLGDPVWTLPIRNTFVDFQVASRHLRRAASAPAILYVPNTAPSDAQAVAPIDLQAVVPGASRDVPVATPAVQSESAAGGAVRRRRRPLKISPDLLSLLGTPELPTLGSAGHNRSRCKPCAFFWKDDGCQSGTTCMFCHLCRVEEKKSRRKEKTLRNFGQSIGSRSQRGSVW